MVDINNLQGAGAASVAAAVHGVSAGGYDQPCTSSFGHLWLKY